MRNRGCPSWTSSTLKVKELHALETLRRVGPHPPRTWSLAGDSRDESYQRIDLILINHSKNNLNGHQWQKDKENVVDTHTGLPWWLRL